MNLNEIQKIEDFELRSIRLKYWNLRHKAFRDEHNISETELAKVHEELYKKEEAEIEEYMKKKALNDSSLR